MATPLQESLEGKYEILEKIGEGGIGSVYKVRHRLLEEIRVIKILRSKIADDEGLQERFLHEAKMAIRLKHPNIAQLHDFSIAQDGTAFIVMEFIDGVALDVVLKACGPPSLPLAIEIARQALAALGYLHAHRLVHRDVAPDNLMLTTSYDGSPAVKLIDLGIAKNLAADVGLTQTGVFLGKVRYSSPEQFSGGEEAEPDLDHRSDIYSFGVLLYELLTGHYPYRGDTFTELAGCHLFQEPRDFAGTDAKKRIPEELRALVLQALEKDPGERFESAEEFATALEAFAKPKAGLGKETKRVLKKAAAAAPKLADSRAPGSTQNHLDEQFGMQATPLPTALSEIRGGEEGSARAGPPPARSRMRPSLLIGLAAVLILAGVAVGLWFGLSRGDRGDGSGPSGMAETAAEEAPGAVRAGESDLATPLIEVVPRWSPALIAASELDLTGSDLEEPPLTPEEEAELKRAAAPPIVERAPPAVPATRRTGPVAAEPRVAEVEETETSTEPQRTEEIFNPGIGVVAPVLTALPTIEWPEEARSRREAEVVIVTVLVSETGEVLVANLKSGPRFKRRLREAAVDYARQARYRPALKNGVAGRMWTDVRIVFPAE